MHRTNSPSTYVMRYVHSCQILLIIDMQIQQTGVSHAVMSSLCTRHGSKEDAAAATR